MYQPEEKLASPTIGNTLGWEENRKYTAITSFHRGEVIEHIMSTVESYQT